MEKFFGLILFAIIIEGIITYIKEWFVNSKIIWQQVLAAFLGIVVAIAYNIDLLALFGFTSNILFIGNILTGILLSRGSNYIFDLIKSLTTVQTEVRQMNIVEIQEENARG